MRSLDAALHDRQQHRPYQRVPVPRRSPGAARATRAPAGSTASASHRPARAARHRAEVVGGAGEGRAPTARRRRRRPARRARAARRPARRVRHRGGPLPLVQPVLGAPPAAGRGRAVSACTSSAARPALRARRRRAARSPAAARGPLASTALVAGHEHAPARSAGLTGSRTARAGPSAGVQESVSPPSRQAATLSGWPSSSVASASTASSSSASAPPSTARGRRRRPATIAAAEEPSPRPCGMRFAQTTSQPARLAAERVEARPAGRGRPGAARPRAARPRPRRRRRRTGPSSATRTTTSS